MNNNVKSDKELWMEVTDIDKVYSELIRMPTIFAMAYLKELHLYNSSVFESFKRKYANRLGCIDIGGL